MTLLRTFVILALAIAALAYLSLRAANTLKVQTDCDRAGYADSRVTLALDGFCLDGAGEIPVASTLGRDDQ